MRALSLAPALIAVIGGGMPSTAAAQKFDPIAEVKAHCARQWGDNYRMQSYCRKTSFQAILKFIDWNRQSSVPKNIRVRIYGRCRQQWRDNWRMVWYCVDNQSRAYQALQ